MKWQEMGLKVIFIVYLVCLQIITYQNTRFLVIEKVD